MQTKQSINFEMFRESSFWMRVNCFLICMLYIVCFFGLTRKPSLLYIVVWKRRWRTANTHKKVVWSLLITNDLLRDMVIVLWRINFKSIPWMREHFYKQSCYLCLVAKHDQSSGECGCTVRTLVLFQRSWKSKHPRSSKSISRPLLHLFTSLATLDRIKRDSSFEFFSSWWTSASGDLASDEALLMNLLLMTSSLHEHYFSDASSFLFVDSFALFCSFRTF